MRPEAAWVPGIELPRICGNALVTRPLVAARLTSRSASSGTRMVMEPDVVSSRTSCANGLSRSQVMRPEIVRATTRSADDSARAISPETVFMPRSPATPIASIEPDTVCGPHRAAEAHQRDGAAGDVDGGAPTQARGHDVARDHREAAGGRRRHGQRDVGVVAAGARP